MLTWGWRAVKYRSAQQVETNPANLIRAHWILVCESFWTFIGLLNQLRAFRLLL